MGDMGDIGDILKGIRELILIFVVIIAIMFGVGFIVSAIQGFPEYHYDHFMKQDSFNRFAENTEFLINERRIINEGYYKHLNDNGREVVLFHYPIMFWDGQDDMGSYHLYGHMHKTSHGGQQHPHPDAFNVGVDVQNYAPVTLDELIARRSNGV